MLNRVYSYFFNKSSQIRESFAREEGQSPWRARFFSIFALFIFELLTAFLKFTILLAKPSYESFQTFTRQHTLPVCEYSYFDHKRFQKRVRLFSLAGLSSVVSATIIINLILSLVVPGQIPSYAKTVNGPWDDWTLSSTIVGESATPSDPATNLTYNSAEVEISGTGTDSVLQLKPIEYRATDDGTFSTTGSATGGDFDLGTNSSTTVSGTGAGASVGLVKSTQFGDGALVTAFDSDGVVTVDPSGYNEELLSIAIDSNYIYTAGYDKSTGGANEGQWRIEKRDITTGALVTAFDGDGVVTVNPSAYNDVIRSIAVDSNYIYVGGYDQNNTNDAKQQIRIEKRDKITGALVTAFDGDGIIVINPSGWNDSILSIAVDSNYIYTGGYDNAGSGGSQQGRIEKRDITTGALVTAFDSDGVVAIDTNGSQPEAILSIAVDSNYIYAGGYDSADWSSYPHQIRIEKRDKITGALVTAFDGDGVVTVNPSESYDVIQSIVVDSNYIYAGGYDWSPGNSQWRIEKRDIITGALVTAFDGDGVVTVNPSAYNEEIYSIAVDSNYIYVGGNDQSPANTNSQMRIEKRDITTGALVTAFDSDGVVTVNSSSNHDVIYSIAVDSNYIYTGGTDDWISNSSWRIEKRANTGYSSGTFTSATIDLGSSVNLTTASFNQTISSSTEVSNWGDNSYGQTTIPSGLTDVVAIAGGSYYSLALKSNGTVVGWGSNNYGQTTIPSGLTDVVAIAGGNYHSLALKSNGTVVGWGSNSYGQTTIPSGLTDVVAIAGGGDHSLALKSNGTVVGWGWNRYGQTTIPSGLTDVVAIAGGNDHSLALKGGLRFQIAGNNNNSTWTYKPLPRQVGVASNRLVIPPDLSGSRYIRYKAYLSTGNSAYTPSLDDITINYSRYPTTSTVSNLKFNSGSSNVTWSQVQWVRQDANTASSTIKTKAQVRVASSETGLTGSFVGWDGVAASSAILYFDKANTTNCSEANGKFGDTSGANANKKTVTCLLSSTDAVINPAVGVGSNQWLELQLILESDGFSTSQIDAARVIYSANKAPGVTIAVSPVIEQSKIIADYGYVTFNTSINDEDTGTGTTLPHSGDTGWAFVALEYSTSGSFGTEPTISSHSYFNGTNFASAGNFTITRTSTNIAKNCIAVTDSSALIAENITQTPSTSAWKYACPVDKTLDANGNSVTFTDYSVRWNVKNQIDNTYSPSTAKVRLWTTDMEGANSVGYTTSSGFIIDTTNPTGSIEKFSAIPSGVSGDTTSPGIYITANDEHTISYKLSDNCYSGASGDWATLYASWVSPLSSPIGCSFLTTNENTGRIYAPYFSLKDSYGNEKAASALMTSGQRPINIVLQDVSNVLASPASYKLFMSWEVIATPVNGFASYNIYRCSAPGSDPTCSQNSNYSLYDTATPTGDKNVNYFTDSNVTADGTGTYYYRIATKDSLGNISGWSAPLKACVNGTQDCDEGGGGGDTTPPTISSIQISSADITQNSAIITWTTSETANAGVFYSADTSYGSEKSSLSYATSQSIALSGLSSGATYNIRLKSIDASGNTTICDAVSSSSVTTVTNKTTATNSATYCPVGATLSFTTLTTDTTAPVISNVSVSDITSSGATITWTTNEASDSYVGADSASASRTYLNEQGNSDSATSHSVTIGALASTTTYYIKIKSRDGSGNLAQNCSTEIKTNCPSVSSGSLTFTTIAPAPVGGGGGGGKGDFTPPGISDIKISDIASSSAVAVWQTNELASSFVEYGYKQDNLDRTQGQFDNVSDHKVALKNLAEGVKYYYRIKSVDWAGNVGESDIQTFTTKGVALSLEEAGISDGKTQEVLEDLKKQIEEQGGSITDPLTALLDSVSGLIPEPIIIGEAPKVELETTSATISWRTDKNSTSFVAFVRDDQYDSQKDEPYVSVVGNPEDSVKEHIVKVANILPATKYHYQVRSKALLGGMSKSKDFTFMTKSALPEISNYLQKKTEDEKTASVYWETNVPSDSVVKYTPYVSGKLEKKLAKIIGKSDMVTDHEVSVTDLNPGTIYQFEISSRDPFGNVVSKVLPDFTTAIDKDAPVVSQVRIESAMVSGKTPRIQTIVSYKTDEPAMGQVMFAEGGSNDFKEMAMEATFSATHTAVITEFKPASIYRIRITAKDNSENIATSRDFTILTPAKSESIIDIIVRTFENTFGWMKNIRF